jgi:hypothetical protein
MRVILDIPFIPRAAHFTLSVALRTRRPRKRELGDRNCSHGAGLGVEAWRYGCS